jgi:hypothetical protein
MMGERKVQQEALFSEFSLERHVPERHLLRAIDRFVELDGLRRELVRKRLYLCVSFNGWVEDKRGADTPLCNRTCCH